MTYFIIYTLGHTGLARDAVLDRGATGEEGAGAASEAFVPREVAALLEVSVRIVLNTEVEAVIECSDVDFGGEGHARAFPVAWTTLK